jgi:hypothetical protein
LRTYSEAMPPISRATLAAIGSSVLAAVVASAVLRAVSLETLPQGGYFQHLSDERVVELSGLAAGFAGAVVAGRFGGVRALALFLGLFAAVVTYSVWSALESARHCQSPDMLGCLHDFPVSNEDAVIRQSPSAVGAAAGSVVGLWARRRATPRKQGT